MKLDIFNHIFPKNYFDKMLEVAGDYKDMGKRVREIPVIYDLDERFRVMDMFDDYAQVICLGAPPLEVLAGPELSVEMAKIANDGMADYVAKYPDRFPAFIASMLPPCAAAMLRQSDSPSPAPPCLRLLERSTRWKRSNRLPSSSSGTPGALSSKSMTALPASRAMDTRRVPPAWV